MKTCPNCNRPLDDVAVFCPVCGAQLGGEAPVQQQAPTPVQNNVPPVAVPVPNVDLYDHTADFDAQDISDNKVFAMLIYLLGTFGLIIALLARHDSKYLKFHIIQAARIMVLEYIVAFAILILFITIIIPIAGFVCLGILSVIRIICFVWICMGKAKEAPIVRAFTFLK
ncbi:MAG: zinc ribbon domain-containing protein [Ruminococcus sp.]|nr:zinc ribbon domain-containing protein [Ruminococcus sp.]